jgi:pseudouridine synthase
MPINNELRIQKYLSSQGIISRRGAEQAVTRGRVEINGKKAATGQKVIPEIDEITLDGVIIAQKTEDKKIYVMLNKPAGVVTTMSDEKKRICVTDILDKTAIKERIYPVGRLDMYSEGLLLLTNDGETANKLAHPKNEIGKTYVVSIKGEPNQNLIKKFSEPLLIGGKKTSPAKTEVIKQKNGVTKLKVEISEGKNRQIRRICDNLGLVVLKLKRVCVGKLHLGGLAPGRWRYLSRSEINYLKEL